MPIPSTTPASVYWTLNKKKQTKNRTGEIVLIFVCILFTLLFLNALDKTHYLEARTNCRSIERNLESINTEATPERLDLENAYFQLGCNNIF